MQRVKNSIFMQTLLESYNLRGRLILAGRGYDRNHSVHWAEERGGIVVIPAVSITKHSRHADWSRNAVLWKIRSAVCLFWACILYSFSCPKLNFCCPLQTIVPAVIQKQFSVCAVEQYTQRYRSGHNGADSKSARRFPQARAANPHGIRTFEVLAGEEFFEMLTKC